MHIYQYLRYNSIRSRLIVISGKVRYQNLLPEHARIKRLILAPLKLKKTAAFIDRVRITKSPRALKKIPSISNTPIVTK